MTMSPVTGDGHRAVTRLVVLVALGAMAASPARSDTRESARLFVEEHMGEVLRIGGAGGGEVVESTRDRYRRRLLEVLDETVDAEAFGAVALGAERYEAAFFGTGPRCAYAPEKLRILRARYGDLVKRELAELFLDYAAGFDPDTFRVQPGQPGEEGRFLVRASVRRDGRQRAMPLAFSLLWRDGRFWLYDASSEGERLTEYLGSGHRTLFERNRNDPARSLSQRGIIDSAAEYRPDLGPGETRCD